ncbi:hypothetical protein OIO90_002902 [Microbotryomycetes sp. JL221]|nr:hypothetical protein OIO90_002902 [Microbotryomycetes sp. JL221]
MVAFSLRSSLDGTTNGVPATSEALNGAVAESTGYFVVHSEEEAARRCIEQTWNVNVALQADESLLTTAHPSRAPLFWLPQDSLQVELPPTHRRFFADFYNPHHVAFPRRDMRVLSERDLQLRAALLRTSSSTEPAGVATTPIAGSSKLENPAQEVQSNADMKTESRSPLQQLSANSPTKVVLASGPPPSVRDQGMNPAASDSRLLASDQRKPVKFSLDKSRGKGRAVTPQIDEGQPDTVDQTIDNSFLENDRYPRRRAAECSPSHSPVTDYDLKRKEYDRDIDRRNRDTRSRQDTVKYNKEENHRSYRSHRRYRSSSPASPANRRTRYRRYRSSSPASSEPERHEAREYERERNDSGRRVSRKQSYSSRRRDDRQRRDEYSENDLDRPVDRQERRALETHSSDDDDRHDSFQSYNSARACSPFSTSRIGPSSAAQLKQEGNDNSREGYVDDVRMAARMAYGARITRQSVESADARDASFSTVTDARPLSPSRSATDDRWASSSRVLLPKSSMPHGDSSFAAYFTPESLSNRNAVARENNWDPLILSGFHVDRFNRDTSRYDRELNGVFFGGIDNSACDLQSHKSIKEFVQVLFANLYKDM